MELNAVFTLTNSGGSQWPNWAHICAETADCRPLKNTKVSDNELKGKLVMKAHM
jgi:hypothetical protein